MTEADFKRLLDANAVELRGHFDAAIQRVETSVTDLRTETQSGMADLRTELRGEIADLRGEIGELRAHVDMTVAETRKEFAATASEMRRHYELVAERLGDKNRLVIEIVALLDGKVDRIEQSLRDDMRHGLADIHHLLRTSFLPLDRRVTTLEEKVLGA